jgi:hypothetical protein
MLDLMLTKWHNRAEVDIRKAELRMKSRPLIALVAAVGAVWIAVAMPSDAGSCRGQHAHDCLKQPVILDFSAVPEISKDVIDQQPLSPPRQNPAIDPEPAASPYSGPMIGGSHVGVPNVGYPYTGPTIGGGHVGVPTVGYSWSINWGSSNPRPANALPPMPPFHGFSGDQLIRILAGVAVLLFVGPAVVATGRGRYRWAKWAKWGAVAAFSAASICAIGLTLLWAFGASG